MSGLRARLTAAAEAARQDFLLDADGAFLNHGSFGACPAPVRAAQAVWRDRIEAQPDVFYREVLRPHLRAMAGRIAPRLGATGAGTAFVSNATEAVNAVLCWFPFQPGDEILLTSETYAAVIRNADAVAAVTGARVVIAPIALPAHEDAIVTSILGAVTARTVLAVLDTVTSPSALRMPLERLTGPLKAQGVRVLIDGAHGIGLIPLDFAALGADWLTTNAHKWAYAPRGTAVFLASPEAARMTRPLAVSHYHAEGFPGAFDYTGTRDISGWMALDAALAYLDGAVAAWSRTQMEALAVLGDEVMRAAGATPAQADGSMPVMRAFLMPGPPAKDEDAPRLIQRLWHRHRVQIAANVRGGRLLVRLSPQIYVQPADFDRLARALAEEGWPQRRSA